MKKQLIFYLLLLSWQHTSSMKLDQQIPIPKNVTEQNYPVFFNSIQSLNKNIKSLDLTQEEIDSLTTAISDFQPNIIDSLLSENMTKEENFHYYLFYKWLFNHYFQNATGNDQKIKGGYAFFGGQYILNLKKPYAKRIQFLIRKTRIFNGKDCPVGDILKRIPSDIKKLVLACSYSLYKVHLMPTQETLYKTLYKLFSIISENPKITDKGLHLRDLIYDVKIFLNPGETQKNQIFPTIVLYIPTIFGAEKDFTADDFFDKFFEYVDYRKSKNCLELLLKFLIQFFKKNEDCKGSGIVPRFNNKVTDMIFFAHGNSDEKIDENKEYFEEGFLYFKPPDGENFKVDVEQLLKKKAAPAPEPKNKQPKQASVPPTSTSRQSSASTDKSNKNTPEDSYSILSSIKNFFSNLFSSFISFITGLFTFN